MTTKTFKEGEILTAADVNDFLVNDEGDTTQTQPVLDNANNLKAQTEAMVATVPTFEATDRLYRFDFDDYDETKHTSSSKRDWTAIFPDTVEIVYLAIRSATIDSTNTRIEGQKVLLPRNATTKKIYPSSVYFRIKE